MNKVSTSITSGMHTADYAAAVRDGRIEAIEGAFTFEGGLLLRRGGQVICAFSASGARGSEDARRCAPGWRPSASSRDVARRVTTVPAPGWIAATPRRLSFS